MIHIRNVKNYDLDMGQLCKQPRQGGPQIVGGLIPSLTSKKVKRFLNICVGHNFAYKQAAYVIIYMYKIQISNCTRQVTSRVLEISTFDIKCW